MRRNYPTVSVIIPVYNASQYLQRCVDSVLNQSFDDIEVILVDDGSIDSSSEICDRFAKDDERVKVVHQSNQGVSAARNRGLSYATGTWLSFVDADDSLLPGLYEEGINAALSSIEIVMFEELRESRKEHLEEVENTGLERLSLTNSKTYPHIHHQVWNYLIRREYWQKSNVWFKPYAYAEDILFLYELLSSGGAILHIKKPYYVYNDMNDSATSSISQNATLLPATRKALTTACPTPLAPRVTNIFLIFIFVCFVR